MKLSAVFKTPQKYWAALCILPILPGLLNCFLVLFFWFLCSSSALAQIVDFDEALPYEIYQNLYTKGYCTHTYEVLTDLQDIYECKQVKVIPIAISDDSNYTPEIRARHYCWQSSFGGYYSGTGSQQDFNGIVLKSYIGFSMIPPPYDPSAVCIKKSELDPPLTCDINITSIINGAFSNKFPLDLFSGFNNTPQISACPSFTIDGQTFQLCYINKLVGMIKYVLLLVFIITSVIAL